MNAVEKQEKRVKKMPRNAPHLDYVLLNALKQIIVNIIAHCSAHGKNVGAAIGKSSFFF